MSTKPRGALWSQAVQVWPAKRRREAEALSTATGRADAVAAVADLKRINKNNAALRQQRLSHESSPIIDFTLGRGNAQNAAVSGQCLGIRGQGRCQKRREGGTRQGRTSQRGEVDSRSRRLPDG